MPDESFSDSARGAARKRAGTGKLSQPAELRGVPDTGRIVKLFVGQGHGVIRTSKGREIYFHRADIKEGTSINDFAIGDTVSFERLEDAISGARALDVVRRRQATR
jgi:cold shock CspA family protein